MTHTQSSSCYIIGSIVGYMYFWKELYSLSSNYSWHSTWCYINSSRQHTGWSHNRIYFTKCSFWRFQSQTQLSWCHWLYSPCHWTWGGCCHYLTSTCGEATDFHKSSVCVCVCACVCVRKWTRPWEHSCSQIAALELVSPFSFAARQQRICQSCWTIHQYLNNQSF